MISPGDAPCAGPRPRARRRKAHDQEKEPANGLPSNNKEENINDRSYLPSSAWGFRDPDAGAEARQDSVCRLPRRGDPGVWVWSALPMVTTWRSTGSLLVLAKGPLHITPDQIRWLTVAATMFVVVGGPISASISDRCQPQDDHPDRRRRHDVLHLTDPVRADRRATDRRSPVDRHRAGLRDPAPFPVAAELMPAQHRRTYGAIYEVMPRERLRAVAVGRRLSRRQPNGFRLDRAARRVGPVRRAGAASIWCSRSRALAAAPRAPAGGGGDRQPIIRRAATRAASDGRPSSGRGTRGAARAAAAVPALFRLASCAGQSSASWPDAAGTAYYAIAILAAEGAGRPGCGGGDRASG